MFALPNPYVAKREVITAQPDGAIRSSWEPCRVIGITKDDEGEPAYLVEVNRRGDTHLAVEPYIRRTT